MRGKRCLWPDACPADQGYECHGHPTENEAWLDAELLDLFKQPGDNRFHMQSPSQQTHYQAKRSDQRYEPPFATEQAGGGVIGPDQFDAEVDKRKEGNRDQSHEGTEECCPAEQLPELGCASHRHFRGWLAHSPTSLLGRLTPQRFRPGK